MLCTTITLASVCCLEYISCAQSLGSWLFSCLYYEQRQRSRFSDWLFAGRLRGQNLNPDRRKTFSSQHPDRMQGPPSLQSSGWPGRGARPRRVPHHSPPTLCRSEECQDVCIHSSILHTYVSVSWSRSMACSSHAQGRDAKFVDHRVKVVNIGFMKSRCQIFPTAQRTESYRLLQIFLSSFAYIQERPFHYCYLLSPSLPSPKLCSFLNSPTVKDSYMLVRVVSAGILCPRGSAKISRRLRGRICQSLRSRRVSRKQKICTCCSLHAGFFRGLLFDLKMEAICALEIPVFRRATLSYIQEDRSFHSHCCEDIKSDVATHYSGSAVLGVVVFVFLWRALRFMEGGQERQDLSVQFIHPTNSCTSCRLQATSGKTSPMLLRLYFLSAY